MADRPVQEKPKLRFEPLDRKKHNRAAFSCQQESLDRYLKEHATQEIKKRVAAVYVLTPDGKTIAGYYTLSQYAIEAGELPPELVQHYTFRGMANYRQRCSDDWREARSSRDVAWGNSCSWGP